MHKAAVLCGAVLQSACNPPYPVYPRAPARYYMATFETTRSTQGGEIPRQSDILAKDAPALLGAGKTVAFLPPDSCTTDSVAPNGAQASSTAIQMKCGALLASLEAEVAKSGYSVVSWQTLKTSVAAASQQRARELNVDVIFEINQLSQEQREPGARQLSNLSFAQSDGDGPNRPLTVSSDVANRCVGMVPSLNRGTDNEFLSTINLKAVDVKSGRALWLYQNSVVELVGENGLAKQRFVYVATGQRREPNWTPGPVAGIVVPLGLGIPFTLLGVGLQFADSPMDTVGKVSIGVGVALLIPGIINAVRHKTPDTRVPEPTYASAPDVLCVGDPVARTKPPAAADTAPAAHDASSYSFGQKTAAASDPERERAQRLAQMITRDFVHALKTVAAKP